MICSSGKIWYVKRSEAKEALGKLRAAGRDTGHLHAYLCPECGYFHLGTKRIMNNIISNDWHRKRKADR